MNYPTPNGSRRACCLRTGGAICFFAFLFALALGLILGAVFSDASARPGRADRICRHYAGSGNRAAGLLA